MAFPNPRSNFSSLWQNNNIAPQHNFMSPNVRAARSNWHVNYDHPREQAGQVVQGSQAGATSTADEVMADDQENDDEQEEGDELEDDDEELENEDEGGDEANSSGEESVDDPDAVGFSDKLRAFLQPNFSAEQTGAGQATYALPGGEDDDDEGGDEEDVEEDPEEHIRKKAKKGRKESTRWAHLTDRRRKGVGVHRGPRKAAPMTPEISMRMSEATDAMIKQNFNTAATIALEVIRINAETHQAWTLLAAIWQEVGEKTNAAKCLVFAAHLRPKLVSAWTSAAEYCLDETGSEGILFLETALACYSAAARAEPTNVEARLGQAHVCVLLGKNLSAGIAFVKALKSQRANLGILRQLAVVCLDAEDPTMAIEEYEKTIKYLKKQPDEKSTDFSWEDLDTYIVLLEDIGEWANAIHEIKSVSRWLNGRERQNFWDQVTENDCEWDADDSRRKEIPEFAEGGAKITADSLLMPLEIRVKLGMNRLMLGQLEEAMVHLSYLDPKNERGGSKVADYPHLFLQAADRLADGGFHDTALPFYQALKVEDIDVDCQMLTAMARGFAKAGDETEAIAHYLEAQKLDDTGIECRMELAKIYENQNMQAEAYSLVNEVININKRQSATARGPRKSTKNMAAKDAVEGATPRPEFGDKPATALQEEDEPRPRGRYRQRAPRTGEDLRSARARRLEAEREATSQETKRLKAHYDVTIESFEGMRRGDLKCTHAWMNAATELINDFRAFRPFYPYEKYRKFLGYSADTLMQIETPLNRDIKSMAERLSKGLNVEIDTNLPVPAMEIPNNYRGLEFNVWLDMFMELAMCLAKHGFSNEAYALCDAAKDCIIWVHSKEDTFLIHLCFCMCALFANDEHVAIDLSKYFAKKYQFTSDSYRLVSAVARVCHSPVSWYSAGPMQKYVLREVKTMDWALVDNETKKKFLKGAGGITNDESYRNTDMDINLLMLYGYILFVSSSYILAVNYFMRCHAMDPNNPVINLMIGLAYISDCLKRQAENRQYSILQGMYFMFVYYDARKSSPHLEERQEAHYNMGRTYHMLGLPHLAIPYYQKVLDEVANGVGRSEREDLVTETAYNLQTMYATSGNLEMARQITKRWLVI